MTPLPPHAYVPGRTARHPEDAFDALRATAVAGMDIRQLSSSDAWRAGGDFAAAGYYWEAHEVWEPVWLACPPNSAEALAVRGAIQLVNAALKARMGRERAARRLVDAASGLFAEAARRAADPRFALSADLRSTLEGVAQDYAV